MQTSAKKKLEFLVSVGNTLNSTETSSWDETQTEWKFFNPYFSSTVKPAKGGIKLMHSGCVFF